MSGACGRLNERLNGATRRDLTPEVGAHKSWVWGDADSAEVESVGVPASANSRIVVVIAVGVPDASVLEKLKAVVRKVVSCASKGRGILRASCSVSVVPSIVLAAAVVEESEKPNHGDVGPCTCGEQESIALDTAPMVRTMNGIARRVKLLGDELPEMVKIIVHCTRRELTRNKPNPSGGGRLSQGSNSEQTPAPASVRGSGLSGVATLGR